MYLTRFRILSEKHKVFEDLLVIVKNDYPFDISIVAFYRSYVKGTAYEVGP